MFGPFGSPAGMPPMGGGGLLAQLLSQGGPGLAALLAQFQGAQPGMSTPAGPATSLSQAPLSVPTPSNAGFQPWNIPHPAGGAPSPGGFNPTPSGPWTWQNGAWAPSNTGNTGQGGSDGGRGVGSGNANGGQPGSRGPENAATHAVDALMGLATGALVGGPASIALDRAITQANPQATPSLLGFARSLMGDPSQFSGFTGPLGQAMTRAMDINPAAYGFSADPGFLSSIDATQKAAQTAVQTGDPSYGGAPGVGTGGGFGGSTGVGIGNGIGGPGASIGDGTGSTGVGIGNGVGGVGGDAGGGSGGIGGGGGDGTGGAGSDRGGGDRGAGHYAKGGIVKGRGGPRSDTVSAKLSPGEAVVNEPAVKAAGKRVIYRLNKIGNTRESAGMKRQQAKRLISAKLTVR